MPIYLYQEILPGGAKGEIVEMEHGMADPPPRSHPVSGHPLRRLYTAPSLGIRHTEGRSKKLTSDSSLEKAGFTKYVRDKGTGEYHRTVGKEGPAQFKPR